MDDADPDIDFGNLISPRRLARWQAAAESSGLSFEDFISDALENAAGAVEREKGEIPRYPPGYLPHEHSRPQRHT